MVWYIASRLLQAVFNLLFIASMVFWLVRLIGDPTTLLVPQYAPAAVVHQVKANLGLDHPLYVQYFNYLNDLMHLNLGTSFATGQPITHLLLSSFVATLLLSLVALVIAVVVALPLGVLSAVYRGTVIDTFARTFALLGQSTPTFYMSIVLVLVFGVNLRWLPVAGRSGPSSYILPGIALGWAAMAGIIRLTRSSMLDTLEADYIRMARAKGLPTHVIAIKQALRNALIPVATYTGLVLAGFLGGAVVIESIFNWQGIGQTTLNAVQDRDYPLIQGAVIVVAACFIIVNFIVDLLYLVIDPRIRYRTRGARA
jgi:peptide/nickel transport system permease protein